MNKKYSLLLIIGGIILLVFIVWTRSNSSKSTNSFSPVPTQDSIQTQTPPSPTQNPANRKDFVLETGSYYYKPNLISVKKGDTVLVTINSVDMLHDFVIDELNVQSAKVSDGKSATVEFVASQAGEFTFYCSVGDHRAQGMVGTLIVTE